MNSYNLKKYAAKMRKGAAKRTIAVYRKVVIAFVCVMILFCSTGLWMPDTSTIVNSDFGTTEQTSDNITLCLKNWELNDGTGYMEAKFRVKLENYVYSPSLKFRAELYSDNSQATPLDCKINYSDEDTLIISMKDLPKGWKILSLRIGDNTDTLSTDTTGNDLTDAAAESQSSTVNILPEKEDKTPARFNCDMRKVKMNSVLAKKDKTSYALESIAANITDEQSLIKVSKEQIKKNDSTIESLENDIDALKKEQPYQTTSEIDKSNSDITSKQGQIDDLNKQNDDLNKSVDTYNDKIDKLQLKLSDLKSGTVCSSSDSTSFLSSSSSSSSAVSSAAASSAVSSKPADKKKK